MTKYGQEKTPILKPVDDEDRDLIFSAVESVDEAILRRSGAWDEIVRALPEARLLHVDATADGVFLNSLTNNFVILAEVSVDTGEGDVESLSSTISAHKSNDGQIKIDDIGVNTPMSSPRPF